MQQYLRDKFHPSSVKRKVLVGFFLAFMAIGVAFGISHFSFQQLLQTVNQLSVPNEKLALLNRVFEEITTLDQLQRVEAIRKPTKSYSTFLNQSQSVRDLIDSLQALPWDSSQQQKLAFMRVILNQRDLLFFRYLKLKSRLSEDAKLTGRLDTIAQIIELSQVDTSVVSTQKRTVTTYMADTVTGSQPVDDRSALEKLFGKKKTAPPAQKHVKVQEEFSVMSDTLAIARHNNALEEIERIMQQLERDQKNRNINLQRSELELIHANSLFINQLLTILHDVENEELHQMRVNNSKAGELFNESISNISWLILVFSLGAAFMVYLIWADIARSNYYKEQLEKAKNEAEELSQIKQRFLANMSHEIRTPLQSILGFAEQLKDNPRSTFEAAEAIHSSSEHLLHIVNEVLDYSRISSGNFTLSKESFDLSESLDDVVSAMRLQADKKGLSFLLESPVPKDYYLLGDPFRLQQILYNLLGNAIKFTARGFVKLLVRIQEEPVISRITFEVSDTGIGIKPEDLEKIFNQFEQASALIARHYGGGAGLGLTIVKSLVEAQHGELQVHSEPGIGSTFMVTLTFERTVKREEELPVETKILGTAHAVGKVVVVDDDPLILRLCSLILSKHNLKHSVYQEAEKLLSQSLDGDVTHGLLDIRMPRINGIELCHALRAKHPTITLVALTAHVFPQEKKELLEEGFDLVVSKPFREHELLNALGFTVEKSAPEKPEVLPIDFSAVKKMTLGDDELFHSVVNQFVVETEQDLLQLQVDLQHMNAAALRENIHKLAGRVGQIGAHSISVKLRKMESELDKGDDLLTLTERIIGLRDEISSLIASIRASAA